MNGLVDNNSKKDDNELFPLDNRINISECFKELASCPVSIKKTVYYYLLSENIDITLLKVFIQCSLQTKHQPIKYIHDPSIYKVLRIARQVQRQLHKLKGLLRFKEIEGGFLYAPFTSNFDLIVPLTLHFSKRFNTERIILHDTTRHKAMYAENGELYSVIFQDKIPSDTHEETYFKSLWQKYFDTIGIEQRENKKLQKKNVPLKFQKWVCEFDDKNNTLSSLHADIIHITDTKVKNITFQISDK